MNPFTPENLICIASGFVTGLALGSLIVGVVVVIRQRIRRRRLTSIPFNPTIRRI